LSVYAELHRIVEDGGRAVVLTVVSGPDTGAKLLVLEDGTTVGDGPAELAELAPDALRRGRSHVVEHGESKVFADVFGPPPRLLVIGAIDTADALCGLANLLGWETIVADARAVFATPERLPSAGEILVAWPEDALEQVKPDLGTAVVVLTHDESSTCRP
jgi:xanthine dehydrogenase accessory factor